MPTPRRSQRELDQNIAALNDAVVDKQIVDGLRSLLRVLRAGEHAGGVVNGMMRVALRYTNLVYQAVGRVPTTDNLSGRVEDLARTHALPEHIVVFLNSIRLLSNKVHHGIIGSIAVGDTERELYTFLRLLEWFYCQSPYILPHLPSIYLEPGKKYSTRILGLDVSINFNGIRFSALQVGKWHATLYPIAAGLAVIALFLLSWSIIHRISSPPNPRLLAVVPFHLKGNDPILSYVAEGLGEGLSTRLSRLPGVRAAWPVNAEREASSPEKFAQDSGAGRLIQGTVQGTFDKMQVNVGLEDVEDRWKFWSRAKPRQISQTFNGTVRDLGGVEDEICIEVGQNIGLDRKTSTLACVTPPPSGEAYNLYLQGREAMKINHVEAAINLYEKATREDPKSALAYTGLTDARIAMYHDTQDGSWLDRALNSASQARQLDDDLPQAHFALGSVYAATGKNDAAIAEISRAVKLAPSDEGFRRLGEAYEAAGKLDDAIRSFHNAVQLNPNDSNNHFRLGAAWLKLGKMDEALNAFKHYVELEPDSPLGYENVGAVYLQQGNYQDSIAEFKRALTLQPDADTYSNLGTAYFGLGQYCKSISAFEKARNMKPGDMTITGNLADAYGSCGQKEDALQTYKRAIALAHKNLVTNPQDADTMGQLALYNAKIGNRSEAADWIRKSRAIAPGDISIEYGQLVVEALAGEDAAACETLRDVLKKGYPAKSIRDDPELHQLLKSPSCNGVLPSKE